MVAIGGGSRCRWRSADDLNLEKIVPSPYFRSYWVQQNITDMKQYAAAVSDLFRSSQEYREERVLAEESRGGASHRGSCPTTLPIWSAWFRRAAGFYQAEDCPSIESCFDPLETKLLAPHLGPAPPEQLAPQAQLTSGETGSSSDLETRIDQNPAHDASDSQWSSALKRSCKRTRSAQFFRCSQQSDAAMAYL